jgi:hypothetical protein
MEVDEVTIPSPDLREGHTFGPVEVDVNQRVRIDAVVRPALLGLDPPLDLGGGGVFRWANADRRGVSAGFSVVDGVGGASSCIAGCCGGCCCA